MHDTQVHDRLTESIPALALMHDSWCHYGHFHRNPSKGFLLYVTWLGLVTNQVLKV